MIGSHDQKLNSPQWLSDAGDLEEPAAAQSKGQKPQKTRRINCATLVQDHGFWKIPGESLAEFALEE